VELQREGMSKNTYLKANLNHERFDRVDGGSHKQESCNLLLVVARTFLTPDTSSGVKSINGQKEAVAR